MINRILIRIKTVQLLYSYLLLEKHFMIESQPTPPTKEKRFAYSLYLDTLDLIIRIARGVEKRGGEKPLYDNSFIRNLTSDDKIRSLTAKYDAGTSPFTPALPSLIEKVKESGIYKNFLKHRKADPSPGEEMELWDQILTHIVYQDAAYREICKGFENYSMRGVERMKELMDVTFTNSMSSNSNLHDALRLLKDSLNKARELYFRLLLLPIELTLLRERHIEENRSKYLRTSEDINPNMRFVENQLVELLQNDPRIKSFADENRIDWLGDDAVLMNHLLQSIMESDIYKDYMEFPVTDLHTDCEFWRNIFKNVIFHDELFLETLEDKSVFWNDDMEIIGGFVLKTMKRFEEDASKAVMDMYKDEEDARFGAELFSATIKGQDAYRRYIDEALDKATWDTERLAFMDVVVCLTALAEIINFPKIPLQVSLNEYIEIAKSYSSYKSGAFIHGLLADVVKKLQEEGLITKKGEEPRK